MFTLTVPEPKNPTDAWKQAVRLERGKAILAEGYTFWPDDEAGYIAVCKPGRLMASYFITNGICDCPDMTKSGEHCKHCFGAILDAQRKEEQAKDDALVAEYEAMYGACELDTCGCDPFARY